MLCQQSLPSVLPRKGGASAPPRVQIFPHRAAPRNLLFPSLTIRANTQFTSLACTPSKGSGRLQYVTVCTSLPNQICVMMSVARASALPPVCLLRVFGHQDRDGFMPPSRPLRTYCLAPPDAVRRRAVSSNARRTYQPRRHCEILSNAWIKRKDFAPGFPPQSPCLCCSQATTNQKPTVNPLVLCLTRESGIVLVSIPGQHAISRSGAGDATHNNARDLSTRIAGQSTVVPCRSI
jgi:hypothetical protein